MVHFRPDLPIARATFVSNVLEAKHGDRVTYHVGYLFRDRQVGGACETMHSGGINATAHAAWNAAEEGHVRLFQLKLQEGIYEYIAERCIPAKPLEWEGCYVPNDYVKPKAHWVDSHVARKRPDTRSSSRPAVRHKKRVS